MNVYKKHVPEGKGTPMDVLDVQIKLKARDTWHKNGEVMLPDPGFRYVFVEEL